VLLEDSPSVLNVTWFSDEAHFHLGGYVSTDTVAKVLNNFSLHLYKVNDVKGHHMERVLV
jgi:hypothetical protein